MNGAIIMEHIQNKWIQENFPKVETVGGQVLVDWLVATSKSEFVLI